MSFQSELNFKVIARYKTIVYHAWKLDGWDDFMREALAKNIARYRKVLPTYGHHGERNGEDVVSLSIR